VLNIVLTTMQSASEEERDGPEHTRVRGLEVGPEGGLLAIMKKSVSRDVGEEDAKGLRPQSSDKECEERSKNDCQDDKEEKKTDAATQCEVLKIRACVFEFMKSGQGKGTDYVKAYESFSKDSMKQEKKSYQDILAADIKSRTTMTKRITAPEKSIQSCVDAYKQVKFCKHLESRNIREEQVLSMKLEEIDVDMVSYCKSMLSGAYFVVLMMADMFCFFRLFVLRV